MKRWLGPLALMLITALASHAATLHFAPALIMDRAMDALAARGVALHRFTVPQRITPQTQTVVRSSPDLYYALCRYDLANPGMQLVVQMGDWPDYQSLAFFAAQTDNFATIRGTGRAVAVRLLPPGSPPEAGAIVSPTARGVVLIRRLAPSAERFAAAAAAGKADRCRSEWRARIGAPAQDRAAAASLDETNAISASRSGRASSSGALTKTSGSASSSASTMAGRAILYPGKARAKSSRW
ncbi:MAG: DUF1254 domain-containing protein [Erythrobacter sp.]